MLTIPHIEPRKILLAGVAALVAGCGGGGGGDDNTPAPTVQLTASPTTVIAGGTSTLTWSSTNADTCVASGGWSGTKFVADSEDVGPLTSTTTFSLQCNGRGGSDSASVTVTVEAGNATVSGQLLVPATSRSDGDVNDPFAPLAPNDRDLQAQVMPNPVVIGGYVNEPGAGPEGRSSAIGDELDFYRMELLAGQTIELVMPSATADGDDADLFLFKVSQAPIDENDEPVASSLGTGQVEVIDVPAAPDGGDDEYFIVVSVFGGAPMYRLSVGQSGIQSTAPQLRLNDDFIPGELIVTLKDADDPSVKSTTGDAVLATRYGMRRKGGDPARAMLLELPADTSTTLSAMTPWSRGGRASMAASPAGAAGASKPGNAAATWRRKLDTLLYAKRLRADPAVRFADPNRVMRPTATPNDPGYAIQRWHYEQIQLPGAWDVTTGSTAVRVAVVDTGVAVISATELAHPELLSKLVDGYDFISSPSNEDGDGIDSDPSDPGCVIGGGSVFHGTHVAGTIGARSNDGTGVAGVSWGARIMPIRALDGCAGTGSSFDIIQGIRYAAGLSNDSGTVPSQRAAVINLSFGAAGSCDSTVVALFEAVRQQGAVVVASAGNDNTSVAFNPASCPNVINVAAVGPQRTRAPYSNFGFTIDLAAPGGDMRRDINGDGQPDGIYSTHANGGGSLVVPTLDFLQGTSMAAPHVSGVVALMLSVNPAATPAQIDTLIAQGAITDALPDGLGNGLINAHKAVLAIDPNAPPLPPTLSVTPSSLAFGNVGTVAEIVASNAGGGTLTVSSVTDTESWLTVTASSVDANGLGEYTVTVNRTGLPVGSYSGTIIFNSDGGVKQIPVLMDVGTATSEPSAGEQYVLLTDPVTGDTLAQVEVLAEGASVPYLFEGVPPGEYILISGTDLNNDQFICDPAEACGAYPVESAPVPIVVGDDGVAGLDFLVAYRSGVPTAASAKSGDAKKVRRLRRQPPSQ